jgi:hypothetical protein
MKIRHIIPLLLLAGVFTAGAQTTNTPPPTKTMNYKLTNLQNSKVISNPTEADISAVVASLHDDDGGILTLDPEGVDSSMQIDLVEKGRFHFTCQDGKTTYILKEGHECSAEVAIKILVSFRNGTQDWKTLTVWKEVPTNQ